MTSDTVALLRRLVETDIKHEGETSSTMVRAGLLRDIIDQRNELLAACTNALTTPGMIKGRDQMAAAVAKAQGSKP